MPGDQRTQEVIDAANASRPAANDHFESRQEQDHDLDPDADGEAAIDLAPLPDAADVVRIHVEPTAATSVTVQLTDRDGEAVVTTRGPADNPDYATDDGSDIFVEVAPPSPGVVVVIQSDAGAGTSNAASWSVFAK